MFDQAVFRLLPSVLQARRIESIGILRRAVAGQLDDAEIKAAALGVRELGAEDATLDWDIVEAAIARVELRNCLRQALALGDYSTAARAWAQFTACWPDKLDRDLTEAGHVAFQTWGRHLRAHGGKETSSE
jgi:hypothetical protein